MGEINDGQGAEFCSNEGWLAGYIEAKWLPEPLVKVPHPEPPKLEIAGLSEPGMNGVYVMNKTELVFGKPTLWSPGHEYFIYMDEPDETHVDGKFRISPHWDMKPDFETRKKKKIDMLADVKKNRRGVVMQLDGYRWCEFSRDTGEWHERHVIQTWHLDTPQCTLLKPEPKKKPKEVAAVESKNVPSALTNAKAPEMPTASAPSHTKTAPSSQKTAAPVDVKTARPAADDPMKRMHKAVSTIRGQPSDQELSTLLHSLLGPDGDLGTKVALVLKETNIGKVIAELKKSTSSEKVRGLAQEVELKLKTQFQAYKRNR